MLDTGNIFRLYFLCKITGEGGGEGREAPLKPPLAMLEEYGPKYSVLGVYKRNVIYKYFFNDD